MFLEVPVSFVVSSGATLTLRKKQPEYNETRKKNQHEPFVPTRLKNKKRILKCNWYILQIF
jgi:hypothetical protein